ncbi:MAG TPA: ketoacyl-ACP synthase III [Blastocatellia bacterium]|nr:ketoacyl-ACP synthase III [Blastocatellia bacterium]
MSCYIRGVGAFVPDRVVTNTELASFLGTTPDWIEENSGIRERRWVRHNESASSLAIEAVRNASRHAGLSADQIDYLIACTLSPDYQVPGIAPFVQRALVGCRSIPAIDIRTGCAAILYGLQIARGLIESGAARFVVCCGAEAQSKGLDLRPESREISMLFGDGAGALVLAAEQDEPRSGGLSIRVEDILIETDGNFAEDLLVRVPGSANGDHWLSEDQLERGLHRGSMQGRTVILQAVRKLAESAYRVAERNGISLDQIATFIPHQANGNLLRKLSKKLGVSESRVVMNVDRLGNTSGASAFLAMEQAVREQRIEADSYSMILAFGAGFTWGAALCRCYGRSRV